MGKRKTLKFLGIGISLALSICAAFGIAQAADRPLRETQGRPNVVFLLSDDQGWQDYGFMGHAHVKTPKIRDN